MAAAGLARQRVLIGLDNGKGSGNTPVDFDGDWLRCCVFAGQPPMGKDCRFRIRDVDSGHLIQCYEGDPAGKLFQPRPPTTGFTGEDQPGSAEAFRTNGAMAFEIEGCAIKTGTIQLYVWHQDSNPGSD